MPTGPIRVLCVEDNDLAAEAIARKLNGDPAFEWLGWVSTAQSLQETVARTPPDVVCMDLDIPGQDTFAMIRFLGENCPSARVLMLTGHISQDAIDNALAAGAWGYLSKAEASRGIVDGIKSVAAGEFILGETVRQEYRGELPSCPPARPVKNDESSGWNPLKMFRRTKRP